MAHLSDSKTKNQGFLARIRSSLAHFRKDERGVSAIEFALIVPIIAVPFLLASWELFTAMSVKRKSDHAAMSIADLVTQANSINAADFAKLEVAVDRIMFPHQGMTTRLRIMGVRIDHRGKPQVAWNYSSGAHLSTSELPASMRIPQAFYVMSALELDYRPTFGSSVVGHMTFRDTSIMTPRLTDRMSGK